MAVKKFTRDQLDAARNTAEKKFSHRKNVTGVDVGYKWKGEIPTKDLCIRVHVKEKIAPSALEKAEIFPPDIDGVPLDVIEGDYKAKEASEASRPTDRFPILSGGISVGHPDISAGTLGCFVIDKADRTPAILSNWHVLVGANGRNGDDVLQPGSADGGVPVRDAIANLSRYILDADGDAAIARLNGARPWLPLIHGSFVHLTGVRDSVLGEVLTKSGRTTGLTQGRVDGEGTYFTTYEVRPGQFERIGVRGFKLVSVKPGNPGNDELSSGGDSGSAWYNANSGEAIGLHFAGEIDPNPRAEHAIACNMTAVMNRLNIRLATFDEMMALDGLNQPAVQSAGTELVVPPDGPWGPWPPRGPWPPPQGPWPPFPWPPIPDPWGSRWRLGGSRAFGSWLGSNLDQTPPVIENTSRTFGASTETLSAEDIPNLVSVIFPRLQQAFMERNHLVFDGITFNELLTDRIGGGMQHSITASTINRSSAFDDLGLRRVCGPDFRSSRTYGHVCNDIAMIIATGSTRCGELKNA